MDPNWVYKGNNKIKVHGVDLDAWLADGWTIEPAPEKEPAKAARKKKEEILEVPPDA